MNLAQIYFFVCAAGALLGAIGSVAARNPIRGALGLMVTILSIAALFLGLEAQFLAAIQLIVYAGAVVVLFLFVIMLLGPDAVGTSKDTRGIFPRVLAGSLFAMAGIGAIVLLVRAGKAHTVPPAGADFGGVDAFGRELFTTGLVPFELSSALLMVAVLGAIAVARGKHGGLPGETENEQTVRASIAERAGAARSGLAAVPALAAREGVDARQPNAARVEENA